ncbi:MAG: hypothetical protein ACWA41_08155 [Putridiphycobacter sp.]
MITLFIGCVNSLIAQPESLYVKANDLISEKAFNQAIPVLETILKEDDSPNINYKIGLCYYQTNRPLEALPFFEESIKNVTKKYKFSDIHQVKAPMEAFYYFAKVCHYNGNLILAFEFYNKYYANSSKRKSPFRRKALVGIYQCEKADELINNQKEYVIEDLGDTVNSELSEYRPVISLDGSEIYFTSNRIIPDSSNKNIINPKTGLYYEGIYMSYRTQSGIWTNPKYLEFCKATQNDASVSLSYNGEEIFVYQGNTGNGDIYYSDMGDLNFEKIKPFPAKDLNSSANESHASMSLDGNFIYFVSDRKGGYGGKDIYRIRKMPDGTWSKAMNLGPTINSPDDEESPFIGADGKTLYFSSNGVNSMGGFDVFVSQIDPLGNWTEPENLGAPLNTFGDDLYYSTMANGFMGIYASDNKNGQGYFDIYFVQTENSYYKNVTIFKGYIKTASESALPKGITIAVKDVTENSEEKVYKPRLRDGGYILNLKPCHSYNITYKYQGKTFYNTNTLVPCNSSYQEIHEEIILDVVNLKVVDRMNNEMPR